uniref:Cyclin-T1 n=1 Tax=Lygus hesperus TaxID=30085 RepID=A0A0A9X9R7_LYGHE
MAADEKWYFTKEQLMCAPSRKYGYDADKELSCRQQAANFIQDMGQRLQVTQLCINTAIVYMHRFYMFHSFTQFHRNHMASAALFLAAKVEEQPRKLEHVIKVSQICLHRDMAPPDVKSQAYNEQAQELVVNENILLQTLGFDVAIDHPHTHVVKCCHLVRASKDLAQTSYFMASNSLHLTTMCLQYKPTVVACFCIHLACKWSNWEIPQSTEGKPWFWYIDKTVTQELLEQLTEEFLGIFDKCPSRLKKKIVSLSQSQNPTILSQFNDVRSSKDDKKRNGDGSLSGPGGSSSSEDMKKKAEFQRHHPPDYKKHHMSHHSRPDPMNVSSKSSCMFGPPQRTQPSSHSNVSSSHRSIQKTSVPDLSNLGKPEHLHHRPRRPDDKHSRNHEHIPTPYKKFDNKVPSGVVNEFPQTGPVSSRSAVNFNTTTPSSYQIAQQPPQLPMHPPVAAIPEQQNVKDSLPLLPTVPKPVAPLPQKTKVASPPTVKIERSIFSPEKCTPPPESLVKPLPPSPPPVNVSTNMNYAHKIPHIKEEYVVPKQELITPVDIKQEISISPIEEKPPDLMDVIEEPVAVKVEPVPSLATPSQSVLPPEEHHTHKEKKEKKKKKHKDHKEHKDKHKDKHKHKHKNRDPEPIVITIPKEKLTLPPPEQGLKIKIARDKITAPMESPLKIKISQGKIKESKKRDRSEERSPGLPAKYHRPNGTTTLQVGMDHNQR